jgi:hypothetical protein
MTTHRREFLKTTAAAAALNAYAAGSDTLRVGVIGCGGRGEAAAMNAMNADKGMTDRDIIDPLRRIYVDPHGDSTTRPDLMSDILNLSDSPYFGMN